jgi:hypothetical protein
MPVTPRFNGAPAQAVDIPAMCLLYVGVEPTFDPRYDRLHIPTTERVQSRVDRNSAPDHMVRRYAMQMGESHFPAILLTQDGIKIDGNTRERAHALRNERFIEAWVLPIAWEGADQAIKDKLLLLSQVLNNMNGLPLDDDERLNMAENMIRQQASDEEIMTKVGMPASKVALLRDQHRAIERLKHLDIDPAPLSAGTLRALGKPTAMRLDDESYIGVAQLAVDANLKGGPVKALAASINEAATPATRRERLARERQALEPVITARQHGQSNQSLTASLSKVLIKLLDKPITVFIESNPEKIVEYTQLLGRGIERLTEIHALQQQGQPAAPTAPQASATVQ